MIRIVAAFCLTALALSAHAGSAPGKLSCRSADGKASLMGEVPYGEYALALVLAVNGRKTTYNDNNAVADGEPDTRNKRYDLKLTATDLARQNADNPYSDAPLLHLRAQRSGFETKQKHGYLNARFDALVTSADSHISPEQKQTLRMRCTFQWEI